MVVQQSRIGVLEGGLLQKLIPGFVYSFKNWKATRATFTFTFTLRTRNSIVTR